MNPYLLSALLLFGSIAGFIFIPYGLGRLVCRFTNDENNTAGYWVLGVLGLLLLSLGSLFLYAVYNGIFYSITGRNIFQ